MELHGQLKTPAARRDGHSSDILAFCKKTKQILLDADKIADERIIKFIERRTYWRGNLSLTVSKKSGAERARRSSSDARGGKGVEGRRRRYEKSSTWAMRA